MRVHVAMLSISEFVRYLPEKQKELPDVVVAQASQYIRKKRQEFLAGRWLLLLLLREYYNLLVLPEFGEAKNGRPCFANDMLPDFNISHSGDYIMVAVSDESFVGVDMERSRALPKYKQLAEYRFSPQEVAYLSSAGEQNQQLTVFWRLWTMREAILKLNALGVWQMKKISIDCIGQKIISELTDNIQVQSFIHENYFWALATKNADINLNFVQVNVHNEVSIQTIEPKNILLYQQQNSILLS